MTPSRRRPEDRILVRSALVTLLALGAGWLAVHVALSGGGGGSLPLELLVGAALLLAFVLVVRATWVATSGVRRERRRLEAQRAEVHDLLARERESVRRLHEINRMKSDFVSTASHELRTPLTSILGMAATLRRPQVAENAELRAEFVGRIEEQGQRLLRLIEQLLEAAGLEHRRYRVRLESLDLPSLVGDVVRDIPRADGRVTVDIPETFPRLVTDRDKLARILRNLLENALKYSARGSAVTVGAEAREASVRVWVEDRGIGMTPAEASRAFDPFYQADSGATRHSFGVGLGLHLVKLLTEALGGRIDVRTAPGAGSRFTLTLAGSTTNRPATALAAASR